MGLKAQDIHVSHTLVVKSSPAHLETVSRKSHHVSKNSILTVIVLAMLTMLGFTIFNLIATPEFLVKRKIEDITADYYENYFYNNLPDPSGLSHYTEKGLTFVPLRELLAFDDHRHGAITSSLSEYCDLDKTSIKIFPKYPFGRKDYRVEYTYSCKF